MKWVRQYKRKDSNALQIMKRIRRREEMAKRKPKVKSEVSNPKTIEIPPEMHFRLNSGSSIGSIKELALMLDDMHPTDYSAHVNEEKNDFANWIKDVFKEEELASELSKTQDQHASQVLLLKHSLSNK